MGFYGNITNTAKTQFQFDRIYPNRYEMDNSRTFDGIYAGRYVLVEYDSLTNLDTFIRVQKVGDNFNYNPQGGTSFNTLLTRELIGKGEIVYEAKTDISVGLQPRDAVFYVCTSEKSAGDTRAATFKETVNGGKDIPNYTINYNIDTDRYGPGRGYDSTVWQKTYINGIEKYIMIAELNTVVPTFDVSPDAPTMTPIVPHFDTQSTDVYYKLHWQPAWGMKVQAANPNVQETNDLNTYPSDIKVKYQEAKFNPATGKDEMQEPIEFDGAIYFNKAGFDKAVRTYYEGYKDEISILPTGKSGTAYNRHDGTSGTEIRPDIQELKIILPALGNAVSDIWDLAFGFNPSNSDKRYQDIGWKDAWVPQPGGGFGSELENKEIGGMTRDVKTIAGCINQVHDLIGMILTNKNDTYLNEEFFQKGFIYEDRVAKKFYRIHKYPLYTPIPMDTILEDIALDRGDYFSDQEFNAAYRDKLKDYLQDKEYYIVISKDGNFFEVKSFNEKALSTLTGNEEVVYQNGQYGYKFVEIEGLKGRLASIYDCILQVKNLLEVEDSETRDVTTVTGAINQLNDIIKVFEDIAPREFLICDEEGHVVSANWTTAQDFTYSNYGKPASVVKPVYSTKENRWLSLSLDADNEMIELFHNFNPITNTTTTADKNNGNGDGINASNDDAFKLYTPLTDATGHTVGFNIETVTLPYNFKTLHTNGRLDSNTGDLYTTIIPGNNTIPESETKGDVVISDIVADNSKDAFTINTGNKWIQTKADANNDTLTIAHEIHAIDTRPIHTDYNTIPEGDANRDMLSLQDTIYDAAGHVISDREHTYRLPNSYKKIVVKAAPTAETTGNPLSFDSEVIAANTQSTLTFTPVNKWIRMAAETESNGVNNIKIGHEIHAVDTNGSFSTQQLADNLNNKQYFSVQDLAFDKAGHVTTNQVHFYKLPESLKSVSVTGTKDTEEIVNSSGNYTAATQVDEFSIGAGNKWIGLGINGKNIIINHNVASTTKVISKGEAANKTLDYNTSTFKVLQASADKTGHINGLEERTITLPALGLIVNGTGIVTNVTMENGQFTVTKSNTLQTDLTNLTTRVTTAEGNITNLNNNKLDASVYTTKITELENTIADLTARIVALENPVPEV